MSGDPLDAAYPPFVGDANHDPFPTVLSTSDLPEDGSWAFWSQGADEGPVAVVLARRFVEPHPRRGQYVAVIPMIFTVALVAGHVGDDSGYEDRWCFSGAAAAIAGAVQWHASTEVEPSGWHRHPPSGRRRPDGDPAREFVAR